MTINISTGLYDRLTSEVELLNMENHKLTEDNMELKEKLRDFKELASSNELAIATASHNLVAVKDLIIKTLGGMYD